MKTLEKLVKEESLEKYLKKPLVEFLKETLEDFKAEILEQFLKDGTIRKELIEDWF